MSKIVDVLFVYFLESETRSKQINVNSI